MSVSRSQRTFSLDNLLTSRLEQTLLNSTRYMQPEYGALDGHHTCFHRGQS
jgi:hypothetical protein